MPGDFDPTGISAALSGGRRCVPLQIMADGSGLAKSAALAVRALTTSVFAPVVHFEPLKGAQPFVEPADVRHPEEISVLADFPRWAAWVADVTGEGGAGLGDLAASLEPFSSHIRVLFLKLSDNAEVPREILEICRLPRTFVFVFSNSAGTVSRSDLLLARGIALHLFTAWRSYGERGDGDEVAALGIPPHPDGHGPYTAGFGFAGYDIEYHKRRFAHRIAEAARREWVVTGVNSEVPSAPPSREVLEFHLPRKGFTVLSGEAKPRGSELVLGSEVFTVGFSRRMPELPKRKLTQARDWLARLVAAAARSVSILQFAALPQVLRALDLRANRFPAWVHQRVLMFVGPNVPSPGLFENLMRRLEAAQFWLETLATIGLHTPAHRPPDRLLPKARQGVDGFPNLVGGLVRWGLLGVALVWCGYGGTIIESAGFAGPQGAIPADPRYTTTLDAVSGVLLLAVLSLWLWCALRISRQAALAVKYAIIRLILAASEKTKDSIRRGALAGLEDVKQMLHRLDVLRTEWAAVPAGFPAAPSAGENTTMQFSDSAMDAAVSAEFGKVVDKFHRKFHEAIWSGSDGLPDLDHAKWLAEALRLSGELGEELLFHLSFEAVADSLQLDPAERTKQFALALQSARKPSFGQVYRGASEITGLGHTWADRRGHADRVALRCVPLPMLVVFGLYPVNTQAAQETMPTQP